MPLFLFYIENIGLTKQKGFNYFFTKKKKQYNHSITIA